MFWLPWGIDVVAALILVYYFVVGLGDGSVSSFNIVLWLVIVCVSVAVVGGSLALRASGRTVQPDPPVRSFSLANAGGGGPVNLVLLGVTQSPNRAIRDIEKAPRKYHAVPMGRTLYR
jgi:hypothetical protein